MRENMWGRSKEGEMEARRNPWRTPSPEEEGFPRETTKRSFVTILLLSTYATGNDRRLLRKRVSLFCTKA